MYFGLLDRSAVHCSCCFFYYIRQQESWKCEAKPKPGRHGWFRFIYRYITRSMLWHGRHGSSRAVQTYPRKDRRSCLPSTGTTKPSIELAVGFGRIWKTSNQSFTPRTAHHDRLTVNFYVANNEGTEAWWRASRVAIPCPSYHNLVTNK